MSMARKSTGKRLRFKVFERDGFTCQYCGKRPPEVILHADHIIPVSKGGENEIENLLTACADCNLGKATRIVGESPLRSQKNEEELQERFDQLKAFYRLQKKMATFREDAVDEIDDYWNEVWPKMRFAPKGRASIKGFLKIFTPDEIKDAIDISLRMKDTDSAFKYMCGVLHNRRKEREKAVMLSDEDI